MKRIMADEIAISMLAGLENEDCAAEGFDAAMVANELADWVNINEEEAL